jgi:site-specific recombinase XerD
MAATIEQLKADFLEELEIGQGRSAKTVANYSHYLSRFFAQQQVKSIKDITLDSVRAFRRYLNQQGSAKESGLSLATQNYHLIALRQFLKYISQRDIASLTPEKVGLAKLPEREVDVLYPEEVDALLSSPQGDSMSASRDSAILHLLFSTGLRISELVKLNRDHIREDSNEVVVRGKGNKVRVVFLSSQAKEAAGSYLARRTDVDPALFIRHKKGVGEADNLRLTTRTVQRIIRHHAAKAGLTKKVTPHTLRHSFATDLLSNGADVRQVQQLLGHASITTTQIYTHLTDVHLRDIHAKFHRRNKIE